MNASYPSKVLLFGEYTIIKGSQALAKPLSKFNGTWKNPVPDSYPASYKKTLREFAEYLDLKKENSDFIAMNLIGFKNDLNNGLGFISTIPVGFGLGSSGALCAGVFDKYVVDKKGISLIDLKQHFALMESFFHGSSSGFDPLVCYLNKMVFIKSKTDFQTLESVSPIKDGQFFLLNTGIPRKTEPLVKWFMEQCKDDIFERRCASELAEYQEDAIHFYLNGKEKALLESMHNLSYFQYKYLKRLIPEILRPAWLEGLENNLYKLKLCGAGGGGFLIGYTFDFESTKKALSDWQLTRFE